MKRLLVAALIAGTLCLPALAQKKADDFNDLIKRYYTAWNTGNPDNASFLYAQDAGLIFFDIAPLQYSGGWKEYRDNFKKNVGPAFSSLVLTPHDDVKITRSGNLALTTLTFHLLGKQKDGATLDFDARHTIVWEKRAGQWLIIHEHVSKPLF